MSATLPPLTRPDTHCWDDDLQKDVWSHSSDQMRAYGAECARAEREACAQLAADAAGIITSGYLAAIRIAADIRARSET